MNRNTRRIRGVKRPREKNVGEVTRVSIYLFIRPGSLAACKINDVFPTAPTFYSLRIVRETTGRRQVTINLSHSYIPPRRGARVKMASRERTPIS